MHAARNVCPKDASREMLAMYAQSLGDRFLTEYAKVGKTEDVSTHPPLETRIGYLYNLAIHYRLGIKEPEGTERRAS